MARVASLLLLLPLFAVLLAACGGGSTNKSGSSTATGGGSDDAYLKVICGGTDNFLNALNTATTADEISKVIQNFIGQLKRADPPADLRQFNDQFIKYLQDAVNNPTSLVSAKPPLPPKNALDRLVSKESNVEECKKPTFLDVGAAPPTSTASPAAQPTK